MTVRNIATLGYVAEDMGSGQHPAGEDYKRRRNDLGLSRSELAKRAGVDRSRVQMLEEDDPRLRSNTVGAIDRALGDLEREMGMDMPSQVKPIGDPADDMMEVVVEGNFGVRAVVKGPVRDKEALQEFVRNLIADMGNGGDQ